MPRNRKKVLHVIVNQASNLQSVSYWGKQNPYVSVSTLPEKSITKRTLAHEEGDTEPSWNEDLHNHLIMDITELPRCAELQLELFSEGNVTDDLIGSTCSSCLCLCSLRHDDVLCVGATLKLPEPWTKYLAESPVQYTLS